MVQVKSQKKNAPLAKYFIFVLLIALPIIGYFMGMQHQKSITSQTPPAANANATTDNDFKIYKGRGFEIKIPAAYEIEDAQQNIWVSFKHVIKEGSNEKNILISSEKTNLQDPCTQKFEGTPNAQCTTINGYRTLDLGSDKPPYAMGPIEYNYHIINNGMLYQIQFLDIEEQEKNQILSTFRFTN